eukprot:scaffold4061_cov344-Prasinococcus_capsulatus_cf.AAC.3
MHIITSSLQSQLSMRPIVCVYPRSICENAINELDLQHVDHSELACNYVHSVQFVVGRGHERPQSTAHPAVSSRHRAWVQLHERKYISWWSHARHRAMPARNPPRMKCNVHTCNMQV